MKLTPIERVKLLEILPDRGSIFNLKILRKLRESLSFAEEELGKVDIRNEYQCPHREDDTGKKCNNKGFFSEAPKCGTHDLLMEPTGKINFTFQPQFALSEKDIYMGQEAISLASVSLKTMDSIGNLTDAHISLYEKFFPSEIPESIVRSMEDK